MEDELIQEETDELGDEDDGLFLPVRLTLSLESLEEALLEHYLDDNGEVEPARYDPAARQIVVDITLTLEHGMSAGSWRSHLGQVFIPVPFEVECRGADTR